MSEAPKKIWVTNSMQSMIPRSDPNDPPFPVGMKPIRSTIYIRADLVDRLVEALEEIEHSDELASNIARAALKALESAEIGRGME